MGCAGSSCYGLQITDKAGGKEFYLIQVPTINPHDKVHINNQWTINVVKFHARGKNFFTFILDNNPDMYVKHFIPKRRTPGDSLTHLVPTVVVQSWPTNNQFVHHNKQVQKVIRHCVMKFLTDNLESTIEPLKRLGAIHAEHEVTTEILSLFEESFMHIQKEYNPMINPMCKEAWYKLIRFIVRAMNVGITLYNEKLIYLRNSGTKKKGCCSNLLLRQDIKPPIACEEAWLSLKNAAIFMARDD